MMIVAELSRHELRRRLRREGLSVRTGPVVTRIWSGLEPVARGIELHYARHPVRPPEDFADFHVRVDPPAGLRRWISPQVKFWFDGQDPFLPLPGSQGFPLLEWGMNWCVYTHYNKYVTLHSAVLERDGRALVLPAPSGSGKSTLCAGLAFRGWRLMSDELSVFDPRSDEIVAVPRPISLKNRSIDVIRAHAPEAEFSPPVADTLKGTVAHVRPPADAVERGDVRARAHWIVLPRYEAGASARLVPVSRARVMMALVENTFNFSVHGAVAFELLARTVEHCRCFEFTYSSLDEAVQVFDRLAADA